MLVLVLFLALLQLAFASYCYRSGTTPLAKLPTFLVGNFLLLAFGVLCMFSPMILLNGVLLTALLIAAGAARMSAARFSGYAAACTAISLLGMALAAAREPLQRIRLRSVYPFQSLTARLSYEQDRTGGRAASRSAYGDNTAAGSGPNAMLPSPSEPPGLSAFEERLQQDEPRSPWRRNRQRALAQIHEDQIHAFINSPGFGVGRMAPRSPVEDAQIAPVQSIRLPTPEFVDLDGTPTEPLEPGTAARVPSAPPSARDLEGFHRRAAVDFVNQKGWGYVRSRDQVAGFQVHHFRRIPSLWDSAGARESMDANGADALPERGAEESEEWIVSKVELVSLLKHEEPVAHVTDELPRMDKLVDAPVRPLGAFEHQALRRLEAGEELVSRSSTNRVEMLGAVRAARKCLQCHAVDRGELLGAFSYTLDRARPVRPVKEPPGPIF